ncbi:DNA polymerase III subunit delta [Litchfieldia salsa]|uniref:DNA polymerase III subunit delta n=1 Tax=Litchfieldia salsa TaxID=930152 RepID=A0A1H0V8Z0_9BACI|nr:DNA polymerase III subunit delta [Litchfieldia salsa]SDP74833.1 DNA polymerase III, delta subunit [Litchfieldia salsa]
MNHDIWKKIKKNQFDPIYLLYGTEPFLINETKELLVNKAINEEEKDFNYSVFDLEEVPVEVALEDAETLPFIGERRIVLLKNPLFLTSDKGKVEHNIEKLEAYINEPAPYTIIVFIANYPKLDERKKITKLLKREAEVLESNRLTEKEIVAWMSDRVASNGVVINEKAKSLILQLTGTHLLMLTQEIDKMMLFVGQGGEITEDVVMSLVPRTLEQNIFTLIEKTVQRNLTEALRIFYDLLRNNEEPIKILSLLATQFRIILHVKEFSKKGYGQQQIAGHLKVHPFRVKLAAGQAQLFTEKELESIMLQLAEMDYEMKSGKMDKQLLLELFIMRLAK